MRTNFLALIVLAVLTLNGCSDADAAKELLEKQGYTDVKITGHRWFKCSDDDTYSTGFVAKGPTGKNISGTVCAGFWAKGSTVRFD